MATTTTVCLNEEQKKQIAKSLRINIDQVPSEIGIVAVSPEAGNHMGIPEDMHSKFSPALIIT